MPGPMTDVSSTSEQERLLTDISGYATEVFGSREAAVHWLGTPLSELRDLSPRQWLINKGASGLQDIRDILLRIEYGVYS